MADNVTMNSGSGGSVLATDDISSVHYQRVKVNFGADGSATDVSSSNPLPVATQLTLSTAHYTSTADTNSTLVATGTVYLWGIVIAGEPAANHYIKLYDKATAPTVGTDTVKLNVEVPATGGTPQPPLIFPRPILFSSGLGFGMVTEVTDAGTTGVAADKTTVDFLYSTSL